VVEVLSSNSGEGDWSLSTDMMLNDAISPNVTYYLDSGGPYPMPVTSVFGGAFTIYLDDISARYPGTSPTDFNGGTFTWTVTDTANNLYASGVASGIWEVPLSTALSLSADPYQPTVSWSNSASTLLDGSRIRLFDPSYTSIGQWDTSLVQDPTFTFPSQGTLLPEQDYTIRVQARDYVPLVLFDASGMSLNYYGLVTNRSITELTYSTPSPVPEPGSMLLLASGLVGLEGYRKLRKR
jgi:hypothetical protein